VNIAVGLLRFLVVVSLSAIWPACAPVTGPVTVTGAGVIAPIVLVQVIGDSAVLPR
jgi:hypothetical protein